MRAPLALGLCLLALTVALELTPPGRAPLGREPRAIDVLVGAKGPLLPAGLVGSGPERIGEAMRVGDRTLVDEGGPGLRGCLVEPSGRLRAVRRYDIGLARGLDELGEVVDEAREGEVLLLASSGSLEPREDVARLHARRDELLATLGARTRPGQRTPESWALITLRTARGWSALAEGASADTGLVLAYTLPPERRLPRGFVGDLVTPRVHGGVAVELERELASARVTGRAERTPAGRVGGRAFPSILQHADAPGGRITFERVVVGPGSGFLAWVGLADGAAPVTGGVELALSVDGRPERKLVLTPGAPWRPFEVDLRAYAGRTLTLELGCVPQAGAEGAAVLWGRPMLVHGYDRSPREVWAEER